tara:strand:- start:299 stop:760 length:462 start_codon:yes stop_codon:yes gene_type:complete
MSWGIFGLCGGKDMIAKTSQEVWDELLLDGWEDNHYMSFIISAFRDRVGDSESSLEDLFQNIHRAPPFFGKRIQRMPVRAFIDQTLSKINSMMWAERPREEVMSHLVVTKPHRPRNKVLSNADRYDKKKYSKESLSYRDIHKGHRRRDWEKIK